MTSEASRNAISSPESEGGATPSDSPGGTTLDLFGQEVAPASLSALPGKAKAKRTSVTFGLTSSGSSESAALSLALASRLQAVTHLLGSTMFALTWKGQRTPSGRSLPRLRATALRTSGTDSTGWPSPKVSDDNQDRRGVESTEAEWNRPNASRASLPLVAKMLAGWATPQASDMVEGARTALDSPQKCLGRDVKLLSGWPTTTAGDAANAANATATRHNPNSSHHSGTTLTDAARMASWATPKAEDSESAGMRHSRGVADTLTAQSSLAAWATPSARDHKDSSDPSTWNCTEDRDRMDQLPRQVFGAMPNGSPAGTGKPGQLNPALSRWLQGHPIAWDECSPEWSSWLAATGSADCAATVTGSSLRKPRPSSGLSSR